MNTQHKEQLYAAFVRTVPLVIGYLVGKGVLSGEDGNFIRELLVIVLGVGATLVGSKSIPANRQKMVENMKKDGEI